MSGENATMSRARRSWLLQYAFHVPCRNERSQHVSLASERRSPHGRSRRRFPQAEIRGCDPSSRRRNGSRSSNCREIVGSLVPISNERRSKLEVRSFYRRGTRLRWTCGTTFPPREMVRSSMGKNLGVVVGCEYLSGPTPTSLARQKKSLRSFPANQAYGLITLGGGLLMSTRANRRP